jgi:uncharacterized protein with HEPN domain
LPSEKPRLRLEDILENIDRIEEYTSGYDYARFLRDRLCRDAVERCLLRIPEAAKKLEGLVEILAPDIPWSNIRAVGNVLRHEYDDVDQAIIWKIVTDGLPPLRSAVEAALAKLSEDDEQTP